MPRWVRTLLITVGIVVGACLAGVTACVGLVAYQLNEQTKVTTKVAAYPRLLRDWSETGLVDHFPKTIPADATDVSLSVFPGFLQGSGWFQLRMKLPRKALEAINAQAAARAIRTCPDQCEMALDDPQLWMIPRLQAGPALVGDLEDEFTVYAFETDGDWNHHTGKGIAISLARGEVVYWGDP